MQCFYNQVDILYVIAWFLLQAFVHWASPVASHSVHRSDHYSSSVRGFGIAALSSSVLAHIHIRVSHSVTG